MTQRDRQKKGRTAAPRTGSRVAKKTPPQASLSGEAPFDAISQLERERNELRAQLAAAVARIQQLESQRVEVLNRIDWVIDSIHNILERRN